MNEDYQHYLKVIAKKNTTAPELVDSFVHEAVGSFPATKTRIMAGEANEVYDVKTVSGEAIIIRIGRGNQPQFEQEKWAIEACATQGIPVATIRLIKHLPQEDHILSVMVQAKLPGDTLERGKVDYWNRSDDQVRDLFRQSGELLSRIHAIPVVSFGALNANGEGQFLTFTDLMLEKPSQADEYEKVARKLSVPFSNFQRALDLLESEGQRIRVLNPVLNHGDFGAKHIMALDNQVTGIIDFGEVLGESPVFDFARWEYWFGKNKYYKWLKEGYANKGIFDAGFDDLSRLIKLDINLGTIWWYVQAQYDQGIKQGLDKLQELLNHSP